MPLGKPCAGNPHARFERGSYSTGRARAVQTVGSTSERDSSDAAKDLDAATKRGANLGLSDDEVAFYDALAANESAVEAMGDDKLKVIAAELITQVRKSVTIDWNLRETARARIRVLASRPATCAIGFATSGTRRTPRRGCRSDSRASGGEQRRTLNTFQRWMLSCPLALFASYTDEAAESPFCRTWRVARLPPTEEGKRHNAADMRDPDERSVSRWRREPGESDKNG
jgi:hypothetical protein